MRFPFSLPWRRPADGRAVPERKTATGGFTAVAAQGGQAFWSGRSYAAPRRPHGGGSVRVGQLAALRW
jgi:hypothetical protein